VGYGRGPIPNGRLPVFSVGTEEEARALLAMSCPKNLNGEYVAPELVQEQTLANLEAFARRLQRYHKLLVHNKLCTCKERANGKRSNPKGNTRQ